MDVMAAYCYSQEVLWICMCWQGVLKPIAGIVFSGMMKHLAIEKKEMWKEDRTRLFSVVHSERTRDSGHKRNHRKFHVNVSVFWVTALAQVTCIVGRFSIAEVIQKLPERGSRHPALCNPAWVGVEPNDLCQPQPFCDSVTSSLLASLYHDMIAPVFQLNQGIHIIQSRLLLSGSRGQIC